VHNVKYLTEGRRLSWLKHTCQQLVERRYVEGPYLGLYVDRILLVSTKRGTSMVYRAWTERKINRKNDKKPSCRWDSRPYCLTASLSGKIICAPARHSPYVYKAAYQIWKPL